jgi:tRNA modification GTPase
VGSFSHQVRAFQQTLTAIRVEIESGFDFPEEGLDHFPLDRIQGRIEQLIGTLTEWLDHGERWVRLQGGLSVVIVGAPNVGKSSLLNALADEPLAIVSDEPGTTRDAIRVQLKLAGYRVEVTDTAGIRETSHSVEKIGIERSTVAAEQADLILWLRAADVDDALIKQGLPPGIEVLEVWNKSDRFAKTGGLAVSAKTGQGLQDLKKHILTHLRGKLGVEPAFMPRLRHLTLLRTARAHLEKALTPQLAEEYIAEELRATQRALDPLLGDFVSDDLLGEIFSKFCIGK